MMRSCVGASAAEPREEEIHLLLPHSIPTSTITPLVPEIQLGGSHTLQSHGSKVARIHMHDWIILLLLAVVDGLLHMIEPFHRFVGEGMMTDLRYPLKSNTVPFWAVPVIGIILPITIVTGIYTKHKNVYDLHHAILGLLYSVFITAVFTDAIKDAVGRPRPDFFWRCFPDGNAVYDNITSSVICHGEKSVIKEGHKSFPSGHASCSFSGLGFLAWYLAGKLRAFDRRGHIAKLCIVVLPLLGASLVAISRVDDYWHHWQDVFAGGFLGWFPFAYLDAVANASRNGRTESRAQGVSSLPLVTEATYVTPESLEPNRTISIQ